MYLFACACSDPDLNWIATQTEMEQRRKRNHLSLVLSVTETLEEDFHFPGTDFVLHVVCLTPAHHDLSLPAASFPFSSHWRFCLPQPFFFIASSSFSPSVHLDTSVPPWPLLSSAIPPGAFLVYLQCSCVRAPVHSWCCSTAEGWGLLLQSACLLHAPRGRGPPALQQPVYLTQNCNLCVGT